MTRFSYITLYIQFCIASKVDGIAVGKRSFSADTWIMNKLWNVGSWMKQLTFSRAYCLKIAYLEIYRASVALTSASARQWKETEAEAPIHIQSLLTMNSRQLTEPIYRYKTWWIEKRRRFTWIRKVVAVEHMHQGGFQLAWGISEWNELGFFRSGFDFAFAFAIAHTLKLLVSSCVRAFSWWRACGWTIKF